MLRNVKLRWLSMLCIAALALPGLENSALAQIVPFKVTGGGTAPDGLSVFGDDSMHNATGTATYLGKYSGNEGIANVISLEGLEGEFQGTFVFVAANGDRLACTYGDKDNGAEVQGTFSLMPVDDGKFIVVFLAEFNPIPGASTGRFEDVINGSFIMLAMTEPITLDLDDDGFTVPFNYTWEGEGWIEFD